MMTQTAILAWTEFIRLIRRPVVIMWTFVMPVVFFSFIGAVTGGFSGPADTTEPLGLLVPADAGFLAGELERHLAGVGYDVKRVPAEQELNRFSRRLRVPAAMTETVLAGKPVKLQFTKREGGLAGDYDQMRIRRAIYGLLAEFVAAMEREGKATPEVLRKIAAEPRAITLETTSAGKRKDPPSGFQQSVPGSMVMFTLTILLTTAAVPLVMERKTGILRRLATTPTPRAAVVAAKLLSRLGIGLVQMAFAMVFGALVYHVDWGNELWAVCLLLFLFAVTSAGLGVALAAAARSEGQAAALGVITANVVSALGGCWWPIEIMPGWMQKLSLAFPTGITMGGLHQLTSFGAGADAVVWHVAALAAMAAASVWLAVRTFRWE